MMVPLSDMSPWWYAECSPMYPASCATLISRRRFFLKHAYRTLRWEGLNPSRTCGMERTLSYCEKRTSSRFTKSE